MFLETRAHGSKPQGCGRVIDSTFEVGRVPKIKRDSEPRSSG